MAAEAENRRGFLYGLFGVGLLGQIFLKARRDISRHPLQANSLERPPERVRQSRILRGVNGFASQPRRLRPPTVRT